mmetsp:Transcript_21376/g.60194  ORF Transcript_21376/g.60194 Transcript_21376/m.60194 type:complete len:253 (+) Transcript_21376:1008-1766(+)
MGRSARTTRLPSKARSCTSASAISSTSSDPGAREPPRTFWAMTCHSGPSAGWNRKMKPGPLSTYSAAPPTSGTEKPQSSSTSLPLRMRSKKDPSGVCRRLASVVGPSLRRFLAELVTLLRPLKMRNVSRSGDASGGAGSGSTCASESAMFCIVHSSRPALWLTSARVSRQKNVVVFFRFTSIPGRTTPAPAYPCAAPSITLRSTWSSPTYRMLVLAGKADVPSPSSSPQLPDWSWSWMPSRANSVYSTLVTQ